MGERFRRAPLPHRISNAVVALALVGCQVGERGRGVVSPTETIPPPPAFPVTEFSPAASTATAEPTEPAAAETPPLPQPPSVDELSDLSLKSPESLDWGRELGSDEQVYINISQAAYAGLAAQYPEIGFDVHVNVSTAGYQVWAVGTNGRVYGEREVLLGPDGKVLRDEPGNILYGNLRETPVLSLLGPPQIATLGLSGYQDIQWEAFPPVAVPEGIDAGEIDLVYVTENGIARFVYRARGVIYAAYDAISERWVYAQKSGIAAGGVIAGAPDIFAPLEEEPLWDMNQSLPPLHSQNAEFEPDSQGGGVIHFTVEGRRYAVEIPRPEVIDGAGNPVSGGKTAVEFFLASPNPQRMEQADPRIAFVDASGEEMAWYDIAAGEWIKRYKTLFTLDSWPAFPEISWIENSLGFEKYSKGSPGPEYIGDFYLTVSGRVRRVYTEQVWYPAEQRFVELTWASVTYNPAGEKTLETILFTDKEYPNPAPDDPMLGGPPFIQIVVKPGDYSDSIPRSLVYQNRNILEAVKSSAFIQMQLMIIKDSQRDSSDFFVSDPKWLLEYGYNPLIRLAYLGGKYWDEQRGLARTIIAGNLDRPDLKEQDDKLQSYPPAESGVRIGFGKLWIFVPDSGN